MKLASLRHGRDGRLVVVSDDLAWFAHAGPEVPTMQAALDDWARAEPRLRAVAEGVNTGTILRERFHEREAASPLPRAYQWADGSAYVNHVALVRQARGAKMPESFWTDPLMYQGGSDVFLGPRDAIPLKDEAWGCDFEAEVAVVIDDCEAGISAEEARTRIRLIMLVNDVSLRNLIPAELEKGFGFFQSKPASAFSPVAVTPDELGDAWRDGKVHRPLVVHVNGELFGRPDAGTDMVFDFPRLLAHAAATRDLEAGSIIGSGTVSNKQGGLHGSSIRNGGVGYCCVAEVRMYETIENGKPQTPYLQFGDTVRIEMLDAANRSIFGAIEQRVERHSA